ncbi:hypothetical protein [Pseudomonas sp. SCB32]|uniref:hypothetical protein n=1 Tax=Pseudomonas sp. SCB32 TaxID=2653853 RepID=UPI0015B43F82|nr:hypothetical protein [Pseudomonas sp. SCB32]
MEMDNPYRPPEAELIMGSAEADQVRPFFITSLRKMATLYVLTSGLYSFYWMYKHWSIQKLYMSRKINPPLRSFFMLFFIHSLARRIAEALPETVRKSWSYRSDATWAVILMIVATFIDTLSDFASALSTLLLLIAVHLQLIPLLSIQHRANQAGGHPLGDTNASMTRYNLPFLILGGLVWGLTLIASVADLAGIA